jgi:hypothetical protein
VSSSIRLEEVEGWLAKAKRLPPWAWAIILILVVLLEGVGFTPPGSDDRLRAHDVVPVLLRVLSPSVASVPSSVPAISPEPAE